VLFVVDQPVVPVQRHARAEAHGPRWPDGSWRHERLDRRQGRRDRRCGRCRRPDAQRAPTVAARALHRRAPIGQGLDRNLGTLVLERTDGQFDALGGRSRCAARRRLYSLPMTSPPFPESSSRSTARPTFSWKRGLLHAVLALVAVVVFGAALAGVLGMEGAAAREAGQAIGRLAGIIGGAAFGGSYLFQTRRRAGALALGLAFVALVGAGIVGGMMKRGRNRNTSLTAEEKAPMVIADEDGERRLRHPGFGFSLLHPGPKFLEAPELVKPKPDRSTTTPPRNTALPIARTTRSCWSRS